MIILKRLTPLKPSEIAQRAPKGEIAIEVIAARGTPDAPGEAKPAWLRSGWCWILTSASLGSCGSARRIGLFERPRPVILHQ